MTVAILVLISVTVITLDQREGTHHLTSGIKSVASDIFSPIRGGVNSVVQPIGDFVAGMVNYGNLQTENNKLRATIGQLRQQAAEQSSAQRQLGQLTRLQHLPYLGNLSTQTAGVLTYNVSNFAATIQIDKGRSQGVLVGMPVVGYGGLVGQVTAASHSTATVTMVTDGSSKVGVVFGPTTTNGTWATVQGQGAGKDMTANYVQPSTQVQVGELMSTNQAQGGAYPSGIPVGTIESYKRVAGATQLSIQVTPSANLSTLAYVDVVLWSPSP